MDTVATATRLERAEGQSTRLGDRKRRQLGCVCDATRWENIKLAGGTLATQHLMGSNYIDQGTIQMCIRAVRMRFSGSYGPTICGLGKVVLSLPVVLSTHSVTLSCSGKSNRRRDITYISGLIAGGTEQEDWWDTTHSIFLSIGSPLLRISYKPLRSVNPGWGVPNSSIRVVYPLADRK